MIYHVMYFAKVRIYHEDMPVTWLLTIFWFMISDYNINES